MSNFHKFATLLQICEILRRICEFLICKFGFLFLILFNLSLRVSDSERNNRQTLNYQNANNLIIARWQRHRSSPKNFRF
ncbi:MAG: hypothetical protein IJ211_01700 [Campylobacter sp.]|nr:hypothetical protein [Campylobacter sp.]